MQSTRSLLFVGNERREKPECGRNAGRRETAARGDEKPIAKQARHDI